MQPPAPVRKARGQSSSRATLPRSSPPTSTTLDSLTRMAPHWCSRRVAREPTPRAATTTPWWTPSRPRSTTSWQTLSFRTRPAHTPSSQADARPPLGNRGRLPRRVEPDQARENLSRPAARAVKVIAHGIESTALDDIPAHQSSSVRHGLCSHASSAPSSPGPQTSAAERPNSASTSPCAESNASRSASATRASATPMGTWSRSS